jgi:hydrogenase 3 maturation protease
MLAAAIEESGSLVVLGVGNELMGDDGAGTLAAKLLRIFEIRNSKFEIIVYEAGTTPENFTGPISRIKPDLVLMIDAADMGLKVGEVAWLEPQSMGSMMHTTHNMPLSFLAEYIRRTAGCQVGAIGIQAGRIDLDSTVSPEVAEACRQVAQAVGSAVERRK